MRTQLYIDGQWTDGAGTVDVIDPSDGSVIAKVATSSDEQNLAAIDAADRAAASWAKTAPRVRSEILRKAFEMMIAEADYLAELISKENGKALPDARAEVNYAAEFSVGLPRKLFESRATSAWHPLATSEFWLLTNQLVFHF
jgi:succinate-semialdehyde dehydrogenase/glutarate-semialdehyde dehydrogenase